MLCQIFLIKVNLFFKNILFLGFWLTFHPLSNSKLILSEMSELCFKIIKKFGLKSSKFPRKFPKNFQFKKMVKTEKLHIVIWDFESNKPISFQDRNTKITYCGRKILESSSTDLLKCNNPRKFLDEFVYHKYIFLWFEIGQMQHYLFLLNYPLRDLSSRKLLENTYLCLL